MRTLLCCSLLPQEMCLPVNSVQIKSTVYRKDPSSFSSAAAANAESDLLHLLDTRKTFVAELSYSFMFMQHLQDSFSEEAWV